MEMFWNAVIAITASSKGGGRIVHDVKFAVPVEMPKLYIPASSLSYTRLTERTHDSDQIKLINVFLDSNVFLWKVQQSIFIVNGKEWQTGSDIVGVISFCPHGKVYAKLWWRLHSFSFYTRAIKTENQYGNGKQIFRRTFKKSKTPRVKSHINVACFNENDRKR